jgi:hypothetical protein
LKKLRILAATAGAALAMALFPAPAQAAHHCPYPTVTDTEGIVHTVWVVCENYHTPGAITGYLMCWLIKPGC